MVPRLRRRTFRAALALVALLAAGCSADNAKEVLAYRQGCWQGATTSCAVATVATNDSELRAALRAWGYAEDAVAMPADASVLLVGATDNSDCDPVLTRVKLDESSGGLVVRVTEKGNGKCQNTDFGPGSFVVRLATTRPVTAVFLDGWEIPLVAPPE